MIYIIGVLIILIAILLILAVVIQNSKGGGLSSTFGAAGGATQMLGARRSEEYIEKITWGLAIALGVLSLIGGMLSTDTTDTAGLRMSSSIETQIVDDAVVLPNAATFDEALPEE